MAQCGPHASILVCLLPLEITSIFQRKMQKWQIEKCLQEENKTVKVQNNCVFLYLHCTSDLGTENGMSSGSISKYMQNNCIFLHVRVVFYMCSRRYVASKAGPEPQDTPTFFSHPYERLSKTNQGINNIHLLLLYSSRKGYYFGNSRKIAFFFHLAVFWKLARRPPDILG